MSAPTSTDDDLLDAKTSLNKAIWCLSKIVIEKEWGWTDFNPDFRKKLARLLFSLHEITEELEQ